MTENAEGQVCYESSNDENSNEGGGVTHERAIPVGVTEDPKAYWARKRAEYKERRRASQALKKKAIEDKWNALTEEEKEARRTELRIVGEQRARERNEKRERTEKNIETRGRFLVVLDLDFEDIMKERDLKSTAQQVALTFSICRNYEFLLWPMFVGMKVGVGIEKALANHSSGYSKWPCQPTFQTLQDVFPPATNAEKVVYLTPDSPNVIRNIEPGVAYIIGGFVDRNRHKGLTYKKACDLGYSHARLPLDECFQAMKGQSNVCKVLTINHVVEVMARVASGESWGDAFDHTLPVRRRNNNQAPDDGNNDDDEQQDE